MRKIIDMLKSTNFATDVATDSAMFFANKIGVNKDCFENEEYFNGIIEKDEYVINVNSQSELLAAIKAIKSFPVKEFKKINILTNELLLNNGDNSCIVLENIQNLIINGKNSVLISNNNENIFEIKNCENIYISNLILDYKEIFQVTFDIIERGEDYVVGLLDKSYIFDDIKLPKEYLEFYENSTIPCENGNFLYNCNEIEDILSVTQQENFIKINFKNKINYIEKAKRGVLAFTMYGKNAINCDNSKNLNFENLTVYTTPGMAFFASNTDNLTLNRFKLILKPDNSRLLTATADGAHFKNCSGLIKITNSIFENSHDDAVNIASMYLSVINIGSESFDVMSPLGKWATYSPSIGDELEIRDIKTLIYKGWGTCVNSWQTSWLDKV